jgi:hypothetical protein
MKLKTATVAAYQQVASLLKLNIAKIKAGGSIEAYVDKQKAGDSFMHLYGENLIRRMVNDKKNTPDEVVTQILLTAAGLANLSAEVTPQCCYSDDSLLNFLIFIYRTSTKMIGTKSFAWLTPTMTMFAERS